ncbi:MAG: hypothetical protein HOM14_03565 [Gammaproteobacteria bacterium]|jgi:hypothetical protein|nr:hypothetical protein [Gammaproteobacteria bacterium]
MMAEFVPNSFQVPNRIVDEIAGKVSAKAFACLIFIIRKTRGWHKVKDSIPFTQFKQFLGIKDDRTVQKLLSELEVIGLISVRRINGKMNEYSMGELFKNDHQPPTNNAPALNATTHKKCSTPPTKNVGATTHKKCGSSKDTTKTTIQKQSNMVKTGEIPFDQFWSIFPKKVGKEPAEKCWNKLSATDQQSALEKLPTQYQGTQKQYIPNPSTYLNQKRWNDEIINQGKNHESASKKPSGDFSKVQTDEGFLRDYA